MRHETRVRGWALLPVLLAGTCACGTASGPERGRPEIAGPAYETPRTAPGVAIREDGPDHEEPAEAPAPGDPLWSRRFGGAGSDMGVAVALDRNDNLYVLGQYTDAIDFGDGAVHQSAGLEDVFLVKLDSRGHPLWSRSFGGESHDYADDVDVGPDGAIYIAGSFMETIDFGGGPLRCKGVHDVFLAKLDPDGGHVWSKAYGDAQDQICLRVEADAEGGVFLAGYFRGVVKIGRRPLRSYPDKAAFVGRLDAEGAYAWSEQYGHIFDYAFPGLALAENGDLIHSGGSDPTKEFTGKKLKRAPRMMDLGLVVARYGAGGERLWRHRFGGGSDNMNTYVDLDPHGNIVVAGSYAGTLEFGVDRALEAGSMSDVFLVELDPAGEHVWSRSFGGSRYQYVAGLAVDGGGNAFLTGQFDQGALDLGGGPLETSGWGNFFVARFDDEGRHVWSRRFGGEQIQFPGDLALDSRGNPVIVGSFSGLLELGDDVHASAGYHDVFVAVLRP